MSIEIKGINNLINKLNKLSHLEAEKSVKYVAKNIVEKGIKEEASTFSQNEDTIKTFEARKYGRSTYIDVGLKIDGGEWDKGKALWFHQWGYYDKGLNFHGQYYITCHKQWFDNAVKKLEADAKKVLKEELKKQIKECWGG